MIFTTSTEKALESSILYLEVSMKIYYSKFVGVGYLVFAVGVFFQFFFFLAHGLIDFSQLNLLTVGPTILFFAAIYSTIAGIKTDFPLNSPLKVFMSILGSSFPRKSSSQKKNCCEHRMLKWMSVTPTMSTARLTI